MEGLGRHLVFHGLLFGVCSFLTGLSSFSVNAVLVSNPILKFMAWSSMNHRRICMRNALDQLSDFVIEGARISFRHVLETLEAEETFCSAPSDIVDVARRVLTLDLDRNLSEIVHDNITLKIGGNCVPLFAMVSGGRSHTFFSFCCVFPNCSAFMDVRTLPRANCIKWIIMGISHNHLFSTFPSRVQRNIFTEKSKAVISSMVLQNISSSSIRLQCNIMCNQNVFQNVLREARTNMRAEQARGLRDAAMKSDLWSTQINLARDNSLYEAFFMNSELLSKLADITVVFMDDTSCTNTFFFPLVSVLCRDQSNTVHVVAWGIVKNRTTSSFVRFLSFLSRFTSDIKTFVCDRHSAQRNAIRSVFGEGVKVVHCSVHVARNIQTNTGPNSDLLKRFWEMRFTRSQESENSFVETLQRLNTPRRSSFTSQLLHSLDSFLPSRIEEAIKLDRFTELNVLQPFDRQLVL